MAAIYIIVYVISRKKLFNYIFYNLDVVPGYRFLLGLPRGYDAELYYQIVKN